MIVSTERLTLRRFCEADAPTLLTYRSDPAVARYQDWPVPATLDEAAAMVREMAAADPDEPGWFQYAVEHTAQRRHIGDIGVRLHHNRMQADLGFTFARPYQGQGYATEAVRAMLEHLFGVQRLHRVSAECDARNRRSARLLTRVGFRREGRRPEFTWSRGEWTDDLLFGLLAREHHRTARKSRTAQDR